MKKFTVLIANYNNSKYFKDCYQSLINQTYKNWEAVIVDDDSTDDSLEVINELVKNDNRFKIYKNKVNKGCGFTKMKCMEYADGEICAYLDPDDALLPHAIEYSLRELNENPGWIAVYSEMTFCDENLEPRKNTVKIKQIYNNKYFFNCPMQVSHFFAFRRETYLKTSGINADLRSAVDQDLYLKLLEHGDPKFLKENIYKYRLHSDGISQQSSKESAKTAFAKVILEAMHRRGLKKINNKAVPSAFDTPEEIFGLLEYQNSILYRLKSKIAVALLLKR